MSQIDQCLVAAFCLVARAKGGIPGSRQATAPAALPRLLIGTSLIPHLGSRLAILATHCPWDIRITGSTQHSWRH